MRRETPGEDRDKHQVVDTQNNLQCRERNQRQPDLRVCNPGECEKFHDGVLPQVRWRSRGLSLPCFISPEPLGVRLSVPGRHHSSSDALQRDPHALSIACRSCLLGRPSLRLSPGSVPMRLCSEASARDCRLSGVSSYKSCATGAGPRLSLSDLTARVRVAPGWRNTTVSPTRTSRAGLTSCPLT